MTQKRTVHYINNYPCHWATRMSRCPSHTMRNCHPANPSADFCGFTLHGAVNLYLLGGFNPSEKYESQWNGKDYPIMEKKMLTTNQIWLPSGQTWFDDSPSCKPSGNSQPWMTPKGIRLCSLFVCAAPFDLRWSRVSQHQSSSIKA